MPYDVPIKEIAATPILEVAKMLGFSLTEKFTGEGLQQFVGSCPISQLNNPTAFKVTPSLNRFVCFCSECAKYTDKDGKQKRGGDCVEMVRRFRRLASHREAAAVIQKHFNGAGKADDNARPQQEVAAGRKPSDFDPLKFLASLDAGHVALSGLDIMPETLSHFKAGYCDKPNSSLRGRLAVAWHDMRGEIGMFFGVSFTGDVPVYVAPKGMELPYFFNAHTLDEGEGVHILPTVFDVMRAYEDGGSNMICPLRPVDNLSLACLTAIVKDKNLIVEF